MEDAYANLSEEEIREIYEDIEADYWISYEKENSETFDQKEISTFSIVWMRRYEILYKRS